MSDPHALDAAKFKPPGPGHVLAGCYLCWWSERLPARRGERIEVGTAALRAHLHRQHPGEIEYLERKGIRFRLTKEGILTLPD